MANTFRFCGKIALGRETERFRPVEKKTFSSGWENMTVKFNVLSDTNRVLVTTQGGKWTNDSRNSVRTFSKSTADSKGTMIEIPWEKRFDEAEIDKVAGFRKFVVDTRNPHLKYVLQDVVDGKRQIDDELINAGITSIEDAKKANSKKREFIAEYDFSEYVARVITSNKYKDSMFYVSGNYEVSYNADKDRYYTTYHVSRITLAPDDAEPNTELAVDFFFGANSFDNSQYEETGKAHVTGWVEYYDNNVKRNGFMPFTVVVKEDEKKIKALKRKFEVDDENAVKQIGLTCAVIDGSERVAITLDMLSEEEREDISAGLLDFEEVKRSMNNSVIGERVSEIRFVELTPRKSTVQDTVYAQDDMHAAKLEVVEEDIVEDLFDDDEL